MKHAARRSRAVAALARLDESYVARVMVHAQQSEVKVHFMAKNNIRFTISHHPPWCLCSSQRQW